MGSAEAAKERVARAIFRTLLGRPYADRSSPVQHLRAMEAYDAAPDAPVDVFHQVALALLDLPPPRRGRPGCDLQSEPAYLLALTLPFCTISPSHDGTRGLVGDSRAARIEQESCHVLPFSAFCSDGLLPAFYSLTNQCSHLNEASLCFCSLATPTTWKALARILTLEALCKVAETVRGAAGAWRSVFAATAAHLSVQGALGAIRDAAGHVGDRGTVWEHFAALALATDEALRGSEALRGYLDPDTADPVAVLQASLRAARPSRSTSVAVLRELLRKERRKHVLPVSSAGLFWTLHRQATEGACDLLDGARAFLCALLDAYSHGRLFTLAIYESRFFDPRTIASSCHLWVSISRGSAGQQVCALL